MMYNFCGVTCIPITDPMRSSVRHVGLRHAYGISCDPTSVDPARSIKTLLHSLLDKLYLYTYINCFIPSDTDYRREGTKPVTDIT